MNEASNAIRAGYKFECKKDAMRQNQDGSWKATINIHPDEMDTNFLSDQMGQRYMAVIVPINDDETPREKKTNLSGKIRGVINKDIDLLALYYKEQLIGNTEELDSQLYKLVKKDLGIESCTGLTDHPQWKAWYARYATWGDL